MTEQLRVKVNLYLNILRDYVSGGLVNHQMSENFSGSWVC